MRRQLSLVALAIALLVPVGAKPQTGAANPARRANPALEQFKTLAGEWEGKDSHGKPVRASYEALASGVVMEKLQPLGDVAMMTMYSLDGDHIVAIHFCSAGNQPVLKTGPLSAPGGSYDFQIERAYGLGSPEDLHMVELLVTFADNDHFSQAWTNLDHGKRSTNTIQLARKK